MRLTSIQMQGFKSFADKIYLDFNSGVTAIVGPNGSGKSNISDAIRWVMGEQSIKSLRGSKMEDVIFAGTETRKPLGFAEVTLVLDNTDGYFPLDFPEITVTRRVYRSGEGEYYINKTLCRLKDIHELFMDTGLGRDGYSIIGQGKIDSILSTKSEDRRQIFEEAAGISKYKYRKVEAERKLAQTVDNLTRVQDILSELGVQIEPLSRQAEKAKKYLILRDELRELDINVSIINIDKIKEEVKTLSSDLGILNSQIDDISEELFDADAAISEMYDKMRECDNEIAMYSQQEREITLSISEAEKDIGIFKNDIEHNVSDMQRLEIEINDILEGIELADKEIEVHKSRLAELNADNTKVKVEINEVEGLLTQTGENVGEKSGALESLRSDIIDITAEINSLRGAIENFKILSDSFEGRKNVIKSELDGREHDRATLDAQLLEAENEEIEIKAKAEAAIELLRNAEKVLNEKKNENLRLTESLNQHSLDLSKKRSRRAMLMDMEREFEGYAKGVKCVMNAYSDGEIGNSGIFGPLAQLIRTDKKFITAVETALGASGQNIVTESEKEAKRAIAYLKEKNLGRATFLPLSSIKGRKFDSSVAKEFKGYLAVAADIIESDLRYKEVVSSFLGSTVICDNIDNAISMAKGTGHKFRIVTLAGEIIHPGGAISGGTAVKSVGSLSRTDEINSLKTEIEKLKGITEKEESTLAEGIEEIKLKEQEVFGLSDKIQQLNADLVRKSADKDRILALIDTLAKTFLQAKSELTEIDEKIEEISRENAEKRKIIQEKTLMRDKLESSAINVQQEFARLSGENDKLSIRLTEINIKRSTILKDIELENERILSITDQKGEQVEAVSIKRAEIEALKNKNSSINEDISNLIHKCGELKHKSADCRDKSVSLNENRLKTEAEIRKLQEEVKDTQEKKFALSQKASKLEAREHSLSTERENIINRMWEEYELTYSDALELRSKGDFNFKNASLRIRELKDIIKKMGNINIDSIEEYKNVKERFDFLTAQTQDLEKAKGELDIVIKEIMEIMQSRFAEQFNIINKNFNRVFCELFGGGKATLSLTEPDNVLESGIEIEAQPPGKKLQRLTLLSGGERAFTAIALLFAILDVRPTPFCILDEIEAALDDVNVYRYADYLKKYSEKTQFIVVTHRRGTMEAANILYGVTMQERGISKLLSLNIDEVKE